MNIIEMSERKSNQSYKSFCWIGMASIFCNKTLELGENLNESIYKGCLRIFIYSPKKILILSCKLVSLQYGYTTYWHPSTVRKCLLDDFLKITRVEYVFSLLTPFIVMQRKSRTNKTSFFFHSDSEKKE